MNSFRVMSSKTPKSLLAFWLTICMRIWTLERANLTLKTLIAKIGIWLILDFKFIHLIWGGIGHSFPLCLMAKYILLLSAILAKNNLLDLRCFPQYLYHCLSLLNSALTSFFIRFLLMFLNWFIFKNFKIKLNNHYITL